MNPRFQPGKLEGGAFGVCLVHNGLKLPHEFPDLFLANGVELSVSGDLIELAADLFVDGCRLFEYGEHWLLIGHGVRREGSGT